MSKRDADEYMTKDHGNFANGLSKDPPRMATAAQQAVRKIKQPKGRLGSRGTTPTGTSFLGAQEPGNSAPQQQATFGAIGNGMAFGQTQSFPPGIAPPSGNFSFQSPQSASFTFGQDLSKSQPSAAFSNAFSNVNGSTNSTNQTNGTLQFFGGFGSQQAQPSQTTQSEDTMMESPQKKPFGTGFGGASGSVFSFGQSTQASNARQVSTSAPMFGQLQSGGGLNFGASQPSTSGFEASGGLFGRVSKPEEPTQQQNLFGQSQSPSNPSNPFGGFGKEAEATQENSLFSRISQPEEPAQPKAIFKFGHSQPASNTSFGFGTQQSTQSQPSSSIFSQSIATSQPSFNPFGQSTTETPKPGVFSAEFGQESGTSQSATADTVQVEASNTLFNFGSTTPSTSQMIGTSKTAESPPIEATRPLFGFGTPALETSSNIFGGASTPQPQSNLFTFSSAPEATEQSKLAGDSTKSTTPPNIFGGLSNTPSAPMLNVSSDELFRIEKPTASASQTLGGLFGRAEQPEKSAEQASKGGPTNLFGQSGPATQFTPMSEATKEQESNAPQDFNAITASKPAGIGSSLFSNSRNTETSQKFANFSPMNLTSPTKEIVKSTASTPQPPPTASKPNPQFPPQSSTSLQNSNSEINSVIPPDAANVQRQKEHPVEHIKMKIRTNGPADTPDDLDNDEAMAYSRNYRLHSLHRELQRRLGQLDPSTQDFDNILIHYFAARERLGFGLGSNQTSTKRKGDDGDRADDGASQAKRAKTDTSSAGPAPLRSNMLGRPSDASQQSQDSNSQKSAPTSSSGTSNIFKSMIATPTATVEKSSAERALPAAFKNPFAGLNTIEQTPQNPGSNIFASFGKAPATAPAAKVSSVFQAPPGSTTPTKSPPKKPVFEMPKFGGSGATNFMAAFGKKAEASAQQMEAEEKRKRKAEDFDSDEDDEVEWERKYAEEQRAKRNKLQPIATGGFVPTVGSTATAAKTNAPQIQWSLFSMDNKPTPNFGKSITALGVTVNDHPNEQSSEEGSGKDGDKESEGEEEEADVDYDPNDDEGEGDDDDDDDDEEGAEDQSDDEDGDDAGDGHNQDDSSNEDDLQGAMDKSHSNKNAGKSLFDRIQAPQRTGAESSQPLNGGFGSGGATKQQAPNKSFKPFTPLGDVSKSTPQAPTPSPFTPSERSMMPKLAKTFNYEGKPKSTTATPSFGSGSIFDQPVNLKPAAFEDGWSNFSRPGTPTNSGTAATSAPNLFATEKASSLFGKSVDHTYQPGSPIVFGTPDKNKEGPAVNITAATPPPKDNASNFGSLFGASTIPATSLPASGTPTGFAFGPSTAPIPGYLASASHLMPSGNTSAFSSRATSPGATDDESVATTDSVDVTNDPQTSLMTSRPGEENEDVLFEARSKAFKWYDEESAKKSKMTPNQFHSVGLGVLRVLNHQQTGKTRMVLRAEPGANVLLNTYLSPAVEYTSVPGGNSGNLKFGVITEKGIEKWALKTRTKAIVDELAQILEANKT